MRVEKKRFAIVMAAGVVFVLAFVPVSAQTLIASWPFNNSGVDASGNGHDATLMGGASYSDNAAKGAYSVMLNGAPDYVRVGAIDFGDEFTICAWAFLEPEVTNIQTIIGNAMGGSMVDGFKLFINNWETANKRILIETSDGSTRLDAMTPENIFEEGFWNHVAITIDKINGQAQIYYNGLDVTESGAIVPGMQVTDNVTIGSMAGPDWYWTGMIDDVRIYQGILTPEEIDFVINDLETGIRRNVQAVTNFELSNYPNPFNPQTTISFSLNSTGPIELVVLNTRGERIRTLIQDTRAAGRYNVVWDGLDALDREVASGTYLYRLTTDDFSQTRKMLLIR